MKTIMIAHNYSENSFASMSFHLAHHLAKTGNRVVFISHKPYFENPEFIKKDKGEIIVCSWPTLNRPNSWAAVYWFVKLYLKFKPQVVIGHFVGANISVAISKILSFGKVKTLQYYHTLTTQILKDLQKMTLKQKLFFVRKKIFYQLFCDSIICPSELAKQDLKSFFGIEKSVVILNPMVDRFKTKTVLPQDKIIISYLGRLDASKGVIDLIESFFTYQLENESSKLVLNIAGNGSELNQILQLIANKNCINFLGTLSYDKIDNYLNSSHFVIIPSKFDNLPTVGIEAMMNQTPLLISKTTGLTEYLSEGIECFKFEPNVSSMIKIFEKVENNFNLQNEMSINARSSFLKQFNVQNYCQIVTKLID